MTDLRQRANLAYDRALAQKNLHERMSARMFVTHAGGMWQCDTMLLSALYCYQDHSYIVLLDCHQIPRKIVPSELLQVVKSRHQELMNEYMVEYANLSSVRTAKDV